MDDSVLDDPLGCGDGTGKSEVSAGELVTDCGRIVLRYPKANRKVSTIAMIRMKIFQLKDRIGRDFLVPASPLVIFGRHNPCGTLGRNG